MARYRALAPLYTPGGHYVEIGETIADDGTGDHPIPTSFTPSWACDPLDASAVTKLTTFITSTTGRSNANPSPTWGVLQLWGLRPQFSSRDLPAPSTAWKSLVHP